MKDIPVFSTENGVATLILREVPFKKIAYVKIQDISDAKNFLEECISFCRAVGAETGYACGHGCVEAFPEHTAIWAMAAAREGLPLSDANLFPVTEKTLEHWRSIYNEKMEHVPNSVYMTPQEAQKMSDKGEGYFVHRGGQLLGIGMAGGDRISTVISLQPGAGEQVVCALAQMLPSEVITLEVASTNLKAVRLYERLGFCKTRELSRWYKIF